MAQTDVDTISSFSKRSDQTVLRITYAFALGGAIMEIVSSTLPAIMRTYGGFPMLWGMWIPLCFITIPPIHYLCRRMEVLQKRIDELEKRTSPGAGT